DGPAVLTRTRFAFRGRPDLIEAGRGLYGRSFKWTAGVKALALLLVRTAADARQPALDVRDCSLVEPYVLQGHRRSPAAALNDALSKGTRWTFDMFGAAGNLPLLRDLVQRRNPDFNTDKGSPVELWLD